jgi:hypothetical protein
MQRSKECFASDEKQHLPSSRDSRCYSDGYFVLSLSLLCRCYKTLYKVRKATSIARTKHGGTAWLRASHWWTLTTNGHVLGARYLPVTFRAKEISYQQKPPLQKNPRQRRLCPKARSTNDSFALSPELQCGAACFIKWECSGTLSTMEPVGQALYPSRCTLLGMDTATVELPVEAGTGWTVTGSTFARSGRVEALACH